MSGLKRTDRVMDTSNPPRHDPAPAAEYDDPYHRATALLFGIPSVHVFQDANKRTAWAVTMEYLDRNDITPEFSQDDEGIERIVRRAGLFDVDELTEWFETGEINEDKLPER